MLLEEKSLLNKDKKVDVITSQLANYLSAPSRMLLVESRVF
jgi:hypothetical protein